MELNGNSEQVVSAIVSVIVPAVALLAHVASLSARLAVLEAPVPEPLPEPEPSPEPEPEPEPTPEPEPEPSPARPGIWLSADEIAALPTEDAAWEAVYAAATGEWGEANLADNNAAHDVRVPPGAYQSGGMAPGGGSGAVAARSAGVKQKTPRWWPGRLCYCGNRTPCGLRSSGHLTPRRAASAAASPRM